MKSGENTLRARDRDPPSQHHCHLKPQGSNVADLYVDGSLVSAWRLSNPSMNTPSDGDATAAVGLPVKHSQTDRPIVMLMNVSTLGSP